MTPTVLTSREIRALRDGLAGVDGAGLDDAGRVDLLRELEGVSSAVAAAQARVTVAFAASQGRSLVECGAEPSAVWRSIGSQVALARRVSPSAGDREVAFARALVHELPATHAALTTGELSVSAARTIAAETDCLTPADRAAADIRLAGEIGSLGHRQRVAACKRVVASLDAAAVVRRMVAAVASRRVSLRPAPDGMAWLTVLGPMVECVGAYAALT